MIPYGEVGGESGGAWGGVGKIKMCYLHVGSHKILNKKFYF